MTRLVTKSKTSLNKEEMIHLWDLIHFSRAKDKEHFELCRLLRDFLKHGTSGELESLRDNERVVVNLAHSHLRTLLPTMFFRSPTVIASPTHPDHEPKAKIWSKLLTSTMRRVGMKREAKKFVRDAIIFPESWLKIFRNNISPDAEELESDQTKDKKDNVGPETEDSNLAGPVEWLSKSAPGAARIAPTQVVVDYRSPDRSPEQARFIDFMYLKTIDELIADPRYSVKKGDIESGKAISAGGGEASISDGSVDPFAIGDELAGIESKGSKHDKYVILHEIWVYQIVELQLYKRVICIVEGSDGVAIETPVRNISWEEAIGRYTNSYPVVRLVLNEVPDTIPNSDLGNISSMAGAVNWLVSRLTQFVQNQKSVYGIDKTKVENWQKTLQEFTDPQGFRTIIPTQGDPSSVIAGIPSHGTTRDDSLLMSMMLQFIRRVGGVSENEQQGGQFDSATEASIANRSSSIQRSERIDMVSDALKEVAEQFARIIREMVQEDLGTEFVFNVARDSGDVNFLRFTGYDINWLPEIDVEVSSFTKPTREEEIQKSSMALQAGLQIAPIVPNIRLSILFRQLLEALETPEIGKVIDSEEDEAILQATELILMMQGVAIEPKPEENHVVHMRIIDNLINSPIWTQLVNNNPDAAQIVIDHRDNHELMLQQIANVQSASGNPLVGAENPIQAVASGTPANIARSNTAREREATRTTVAGTGNQRSL